MDIETPTYKTQCTYLPTVTGNGTIVTINLQSNLSVKAKDKYTLIVLDVSGSMSGSKIDTCKKAIIELAQMLYASSDNPKMDIIIFNNSPELLKVEGKSLSHTIDIINKIYAGGGTYFIPVFDMIQNILKEKSSIKELAVLFLSDGQAESLSFLKPHIEKMKDFTSKNLSSAELHSLGFGSDHDARLLEELTRAMPTQGSFQYIKESSEITPSIEAISGYLTEKRLTAYIQWKEGEKTVEKRITFETHKDKELAPGMVSCWEGIACLNLTQEEFEKIKDTIKLIIKHENTEIGIETEFVFRKPEGKAIEMRQNFLFINESLKRLSDALIEDFKSKKVEEIKDQLAGLRQMLNETVREIFKVKIADRKYLMETCNDLNEYMDKINDLIRESANKALSNDQIATINAMAYRQVTKKKNLKVLDKRLVQNVDLLNEVYQKTQEISEKVNEEELTQKYKDLIEQVGSCSLNLYNMAEALKAGDCLCLTFDIGRPEVAIADASRVIIKKIYPTVICATAFLDSVKYSMNLNPLQSGGFEPKLQGSIVKGASNESITAAMPLYLCPEHWESASQFMKPILGWDVTLDPLGYDYNQVRTVPFLILSRALIELSENPNSEFHQRITRWILDTCIQIIKDENKGNNNSSSLATTVKEIWSKYLEDGTVREVEKVQSNSVFLAHVICLQEMGILEKDDKAVFMKKLGYMIEEEMRRRQDKAKTWTASQAKKVCKKLLNIDFDAYVDNLCKEDQLDKALEEAKENKPKSEETFEQKAAKYENIYNMKKKENKTQKIKNKQQREEENKLQAEKNAEKDEKFRLNCPEDFIERLKTVNFKVDLFPATFAELSGFLKETASQAFGSYKGAVKQFKGWLKILKYEEDLNKIESIGILTPVQLFCLYIQNKIHHKNADRVESFETKEYVDPFDMAQASAYFTKIATKIIYDKWIKEQNSKPKECNCSIEDIQFFAETTNLKAAAGLLSQGFNLGSFERLQNIFRKNPEKCQKVIDKLKMIKYREYQDIQFDFDFKIRKKWLRQLFKRYEKTYEYSEWKELWFREHLKK